MPGSEAAPNFPKTLDDNEAEKQELHTFNSSLYDPICNVHVQEHQSNLLVTVAITQPLELLTS